MIDLSKYTSGLVEKEGILFSKIDSEISYPKVWNDHCYQIEENSFWFKHRNNCILEAVKKYAKDEIFFDVGGGNGFVAKGLETNGIDTVLIEPGIAGCLNAKKRSLHNVVCSTLENASFIKNMIGAVGLFDVVEHIKDDISFLTAIHSYLKKEGLVFITVPAYEFLWSNEDKDAGHYRRYTIHSLCNKLKEIGYSIEYSTYIFSILPLPVFFSRTLPSKFGFNKDSNEIDKHKEEHRSHKGLVDKVLNTIWQFELNRIKSGKSMSFGGSCFIIAKK